MKYTNRANLSLSMASWLAYDEYDHDSRPNYISATSIIKPIKQIILASRVKTNTPDVLQLVASRIGTAIHNAVENTWKSDRYKHALKSLGYNEKHIERIVVNPDPSTVTRDQVPVYIEQRVEKEFNGFIIGGKYDFIGDGRLEDVKFTSTYTYTNKTNDDKYILQGSIYKWLNPNIITRDRMVIQFVFSDWAESKMHEANYPPSRVLEYPLVLRSQAEIEAYLRQKTNLLKRYWNAPEHEIPECSDEDLWRKPDTWKYYKNPSKMTRSTKNYDNEREANMRVAQEGGIVVKQAGQVTACKYCECFSICEQKTRYLKTGELKLGA